MRWTQRNETRTNWRTTKESMDDTKTDKSQQGEKAKEDEQKEQEDEDEEQNVESEKNLKTRTETGGRMIMNRKYKQHEEE